MSSEHRNKVQSVSVARVVAIPDQPRVFAKDAAAGAFFFGTLGMLVAADSSDEPLQLKNFLEANKIDVRDILRDEFIRQGTEAKSFPKIVEDGGDAVVHLVIDSYGLSHALSVRPFDKPLSPIIGVTVRMATRGGSLVWEKSDLLSAQSAETDAHKWDVYLASKDITEAGFKKAARAIVASLLSEFAAGHAAAPSAATYGVQGQSSQASRIQAWQPPVSRSVLEGAGSDDHRFGSTDGRNRDQLQGIDCGRGANWTLSQCR
jgi:hypothetical protein